MSLTWRKRFVIKWTVPTTSESPCDAAVDPEIRRRVADARAHVLRTDRQLELHLLPARPAGGQERVGRSSQGLPEARRTARRLGAALAHRLIAVLTGKCTVA